MTYLYRFYCLQIDPSILCTPLYMVISYYCTVSYVPLVRAGSTGTG